MALHSLTSILLVTTAILSTLVPPALAQNYYIPFSGAYYVYCGPTLCPGAPPSAAAPQPTVAGGGNLAPATTYVTGIAGDYKPATEAVCPAHAPVRCSSIGQPNWCCQSGQYCGLNENGAVGCCPDGKICGVGGEDTKGKYTSDTKPPAPTKQEVAVTKLVTITTYVPHPTTINAVVYVPPPDDRGKNTQIQPQVYHSSLPNQYYNGYCSTLFAEGPGLPTTRMGDCGAILVVEPNGAERLMSLGMWGLGLWVGGFQWAVGFMGG